MNFLVRCECGAPTSVSEGSAGAKIPCACGRTIAVPSLHQLRAEIGLSPYPGISPEMAIERLLASGRLPADNLCVGCGKETDQVAQVRAECERAVVRGGISWPTLLMALLFFPIVGIVLLRRREPQEYGRDKIYWLPLALCPDCHQWAAQDRDTLWDFFQRVPLYQELLMKFPSASVEFAGPKVEA
jgi:hypothetical protein